ncbi:MAG: XRE family transcriptional regulator [Paludibacteraceae bacterium]|nr:XRE family transcriptional regulator [Paludibacteraceae bacterium]
MQQIKFIHIGEVVRAELYRQGKTVSWLARQIGTNRMAIYRVFESPSIDTSQLMRLSIALNTNFFALYSEKYRQKQTEK